MEHGYITIKQAVELASEAWGAELKAIPGKRIMFRGVDRNGESITLLTPQSALQPKGFFWVDITEVQYDVMNETDRAAIFFRFDYFAFALVRWSDLKEYLVKDCIYYTDQEKNHWKLYINGKTIKVNGNKRELPIQLHKYSNNNCI